MEFKEKLFLIRERLGLSQKDLARRLGITRTTVNRLEKGHFQPNHKISLVVDSLDVDLFGTQKLPGTPEVLVAPNREIETDLSNNIDLAKKEAMSNINVTLVRRNYLIGKRIEEEILSSRSKECGKEIIKNLSVFLTDKYGKGFNKTDLYSHVCFYQFFPNIFPSVSGKSFPHMGLRKGRKSGASVHQ